MPKYAQIVGWGKALPVRVMHNREFMAASLSVLLMSATFFAILIYVPQFMLKVLNFGSLKSGLGFLPMMGVFAGRGASAAGTITGVDARSREVTVYLDAVFDGQKEIVVPPERLTPEG